MRMRRQTAGEVDAPAIEEFAAGRDSNEHRRVSVLGDADGRGSLRSSSRHVFLLPGRASAADAVAHSRRYQSFHELSRGSKPSFWARL
jgi:hypothetical protein